MGLIFHCWTLLKTFFMSLVQYLYFNKITTHLQQHTSRSDFPSMNLKQNFSSSMVQKMSFQLTSLLKLVTLWLSLVSLPISSTLKDRCSALTNHLCTHLWAAYGLLVANKYCFKHPLLAWLYNAFTTPHLLALVPFWKRFTATKKKAICSAFYRYAKFLLCLPLWHSNGNISRKYKVTNPSMAIERRISKFSTNVFRANHPWASVIL